jgi:hypothetical protein
MTRDAIREGGEMIWGSAQGKIRPGSLERDSQGVSALIETVEGTTLLVRGYGDYAYLISAAAISPDDVILRGQVLGSSDSGDLHLSVLISGPAEIVGKVSDVRRGFEEGRPVIDFFVLNEVSGRDSAVYRVPVGVRVSGAQTDALAQLEEGDRVRLEGRDTTHGYTATSPVTLLRDARPELNDGPEI